MPRSRFVSGAPRREARNRQGRVDDLAPKRSLLAMLAALAAAALVHAVALRGFFTADDIIFLSRAQGLAPTPWELRPLSTLSFRLEYAAFGLAPLGYRLAALLLHLANTAWVGLLATRLTRVRAAGPAAAAIFGASSIAFTPLHWASAIGDLLAAQLVLAGTWLYLEARERGSKAAYVGTVLCALAAPAAKESTLVWPLALLVIEARSGLVTPRLRPLIAPLAAAGMATTVFLFGGAIARLSGPGYERSLDPAFLSGNLFTYLRWLVVVHEPMRDGTAAMDPTAWMIGIPVAIALVAAALAPRRSPLRPAEVGDAWMLIQLAPVLPLAHHTYLYYLYLPWAGVCWALVSTVQALGRRLPAWLATASAVLLLVSFVALEARNVRAREQVLLGGLPRDRLVRESELLGRAIPALRAARLPPGTAVALVNPGPVQHVSLTPGSVVGSYSPLGAAFQDGLTARLFLPGIRWLGLSSDIEPGWEQAEIFFYTDRGDLVRWGHGSEALRRLGELHMASRRFDHAALAFARARSLDDTVPDLVFEQTAALEAAGHFDEADSLANEFVRRWPGDARSEQVRAILARREGWR